MRDAERLIVQALKTLENDPRGPVSIAQATAYATIAQAMLMREFLSTVPIEDEDPFGNSRDAEDGPAW